jgi:hypothetical protein
VMLSDIERNDMEISDQQIHRLPDTDSRSW